MEKIEIENLFKTTLDEVEKVLNTKTVVGQPIEVAGNTIIPLVAIGFGFGGGGAGKDPKNAAAEGAGAGTGAGGGVKPVALIIVDKAGNVRVEPVGSAASIVENVGEAVAKVMKAKTDAEKSAA